MLFRSPLNAEETWEYIKYRLHVAGGRDDYFAEEARDQIYKSSRGIPRLINMICDAALLAGYVEEKSIIDNTLISDVVKEMDLDVEGVGVKANKGREGIAEDDCEKMIIVEEGIRRIDEVEKKLNQIFQKVNWLYERHSRETNLERALLVKEKEIKELKGTLYKCYKKEQQIVERGKELALKEEGLKVKKEELSRMQKRLHNIRIHIP